MSAPSRLSNTEARRLFLQVHGLTQPRRRALDVASLGALVNDLGFVQLDTINTVARAHDMILYARAQGFDRAMLAQLHEDGGVFEHWTHDASIIPMEFYPYWQGRFKRVKGALERPGWKNRFGDNPKKTMSMVRKQITSQGPKMSRDFADGPKGNGGWWGWSPTKTALEYMWRTGELAVVKRDGFQKVYDLAERVIPDDIFCQRPSKAATVDFKCRSALTRLGFGTPVQIAHFWNTLKKAEVEAWAKPLLGKELMEVIVAGAKGEPDTRALAFCDLEDTIDAGLAPSKTLRFLSPFDPLIRDRKRLKQLFGFDYKIEIFVPEAKRVYGYYVLPLLEGSRIIGRADLKADRKACVLVMKGLWLERGIKLTPAREAALRRELARLARFCGVDDYDADGALSQAKKAST